MGDIKFIKLHISSLLQVAAGNFFFKIFQFQCPFQYYIILLYSYFTKGRKNCRGGDGVGGERKRGTTRGVSPN